MSVAGEPIKVGVLGLGNAGRGALTHIESSKVLQVAAVCDMSGAVVAKHAEAHGVPGYTTVAELCADADVEAVYVATPTYLHLPHAVEVAHAGKHILMEKPVTRTADEAAALVALADELGLQIMSVNTRGGDAPIRALARAAHSGAVGKVLNVTNISYTDWTLKPRYPYELIPSLGGGVVFRQAPHAVEIARTIIGGRVIAVTAIAGSALKPVPTVGTFNALVEFESGASATLLYNGFGYFNTAELTYNIDPAGRAVVPDASAGRRQANSWGLDKYSDKALDLREKARGSAKPFSSGTGFTGLTLVSGELGDLRQSPGGITVYDDNGVREEAFDPEDGGLPVDFEEFYRAVRDGEPLKHDARWGAATVAVCEAIWQSSQDKQRIVL
jgi:phthalate 4,5-cis-dihydrodiol dehydrogenase